MANPLIGSENRTFDALLVLEDGAGAKTATGVGQDGGSDAELDLGTGSMKGDLVIIPTALDFTTADETYFITLEGTSDDFSNVIDLVRVELDSASLAADKVVVPFSNMRDDVIHNKVRIKHTLAGTTPILTYTARLAKHL